MRILVYFIFVFFAGCAHTPNTLSKTEESAYRNLAFFSPSALSSADNREMTLFYDRWASQFQEAIKNYKSAIKQYKQVVWHFRKMSRSTSKKQDYQFRRHFKNAEIHLKAADAFLGQAQELRNTRPPFGRQKSQNISAH